MTGRVSIAPPPMFGQHTDEVLGELGYSRTDIERFRAAKVIYLMPGDGHDDN